MIKSLTTDQHVQVGSYLAKGNCDILHQFDVGM